MFVHNGFTFTCEACPHPRNTFVSKATTRRTAVIHARAAGWFIGRIKITVGGKGGKHIELCDHCRWIVGDRT